MKEENGGRGKNREEKGIRKRTFPFLISLFLLLPPSFSIFLPSESSADDKLSKLYSVAKVLSGDSFQLDTGAVISYASAVAPDLMSPTKRIENYAQESLDFNRRLLENRKVRLEWGSRIRNPKGHYLAYVFLEDGTFANWKILDAGFAKLRIEPPNLEHADELRDAAQDARRDAKGLWQYEKDNPARQVSFIGDNMKKHFHYSDCPELEDVPQGHRRVFASAVDAVSQKFRWCPVCKNTVEQHTELF